MRITAKGGDSQPEGGDLKAPLVPAVNAAPPSPPAPHRRPRLPGPSRRPAPPRRTTAGSPEVLPLDLDSGRRHPRRRPRRRGLLPHPPPPPPPGRHPHGRRTTVLTRADPLHADCLGPEAPDRGSRMCGIGTAFRGRGTPLTSLLPQKLTKRRLKISAPARLDPCCPGQKPRQAPRTQPRRIHHPSCRCSWTSANAPRTSYSSRSRAHLLHRRHDHGWRALPRGSIHPARGAKPLSQPETPWPPPLVRNPTKRQRKTAARVRLDPCCPAPEPRQAPRTQPPHSHHPNYRCSWTSANAPRTSYWNRSCLHLPCHRSDQRERCIWRQRVRSKKS